MTKKQPYSQEQIDKFDEAWTKIRTYIIEHKYRGHSQRTVDKFMQTQMSQEEMTKLIGIVYNKIN